MIDIKHKKKYNTEAILSCEYIQSMSKVYAKAPETIDSKCAGYRNPYNGKYSTICQRCKNLYEGEHNE